ncbi:MAG: Mu-like prophage major head subunit gpT family protein [Chloroflexi bacterium]|nr:Mu-like prophage major head subunit gpT family protein [Chloroflexota bacterium]
MSKLSQEERDALPASAFAVPAKRLLPVHDLDHAKLAWTQVDRTEGLTAEEREQAKKRIIAALKRFGLDVSNYQEAKESTLSGALEGVDEKGGLLEVTIIKPGLSANRLEYSDEVLRESLPLWEGAAAFCDHPDALDQTRAGGRSVRDLVGVYSAPRYEQGIKARLRLYPTASWLYQTIATVLADKEAGKPMPKIGISADMVVLKEKIGDRFKVHKIKQVNSADVVFQPSAGGAFERVLEGQDITKKEDTMADNQTEMEEKKLEATVTVNTVSEALQAQSKILREELEALKRQHCATVLEAKLSASDLPEEARKQLKERFESQAFEAEALDKAITDVKALLASIASGQVIKDMGQPRISLGADPLAKVQMAMEKLFGLEVKDPSVPRLSGIREAYILITGDRGFTGRYNWEESIVREANEVTTSVMADALANVLNKRLVKDYAGQDKWWEPFAVKTPVKDMKLQTRILLNDFAALADVVENAAYANLAWGDSKETYTPTKRGNLVYVTLETIINDDLRAVQRIPSKLASAAAITINEFVSGLFTANAGLGSTMADTFTVFHANHGGNTGTAALSSAALQAAITVVMKQTNSASKRLGLKPRWLLIPPDLLWTARTILESVGLPGTANNDINVTRGVLDIITIPNWTDANNWYLIADPVAIESIELGFLEGREEPELLVQDNPTSGTVFTNDAISFKVRHIYGGGWLDYRGAYGSVVA